MPSRHKMCFDLQLMKLFLLLKLLLNIVAGFTLEWGYHTHTSHWSPSQQSGWVYFGGLETTSVVHFLFKAAIGTLAECLMVCFQRKKTPCYKFGKCFYNLRYANVRVWIFIHSKSHWNFIITSFFKKKIVFSNFQFQSCLLKFSILVILSPFLSPSAYHKEVILMNYSCWCF